MTNFLSELEGLINKYSKENDSDTPDFILAKYLENCLNNFSEAVNAREKWYGRINEPCTPPAEPEFKPLVETSENDELTQLEKFTTKEVSKTS